MYFSSITVIYGLPKLFLYSDLWWAKVDTELNPQNSENNKGFRILVIRNSYENLMKYSLCYLNLKYDYEFCSLYLESKIFRGWNRYIHRHTPKAQRVFGTYSIKRDKAVNSGIVNRFCISNNLTCWQDIQKQTQKLRSLCDISFIKILLCIWTSSRPSHFWCQWSTGVHLLILVNRNIVVAKPENKKWLFEDILLKIPTYVHSVPVIRTPVNRTKHV